MPNAYKRKTNRASWTQEESTKRWRGVSREKILIASSSLVKIRGDHFLQVASHVYSSCTYYIHHFISFVINMKFKNYGTLNGSCSFGLQTRIFP
jgi:hypothetical protein